MKTQYEEIAHRLDKWLQYALAPSKDEQDRSKHTASFINFHITTYCWPEAKELNKKWKEILELHQRYIETKTEKLRREITDLTYLLIDSFNNLHNKIIAPKSKEVIETPLQDSCLARSKPMPIIKIMKALRWVTESMEKEMKEKGKRPRATKKFIKWAKENHGLKQEGTNRQSSTICLDNLEKRYRDNLEKS